MVPSVSLDDVQDKDKRELIIDFIYKTTVKQAAEDVWNDFESSCLPQIKEREKPVLFYHSNYCKIFT